MSEDLCPRCGLPPEPCRLLSELEAVTHMSLAQLAAHLARAADRDD